ncbi:MAG TPA: hypothetical protein VIO58_06660 [Candidatus Methanoperedens sp.]
MTITWFKWPGRLMLAILLTAGAYSLMATDLGVASDTSLSSGIPATDRGKYIVLGWNNLGMHCYNADFAELAVLPPYNTIWAQVVRVGDPPQIVTEGVIVNYNFPENTYSVNMRGRPDKSNFWTYAQKLFNLSSPLQPNIGLTGKGLSGSMDPEVDHFVAEGIPLTEYRDQDAVNRHSYPFQKAVITVRDARNPSVVLAQSTVVAPVSTEMSCINCHSDDGDATTKYDINATGKVETNILALHDYLNLSNYPQGHEGRLMDRRPILCAECHSSNALNAPGVADVSSLSNAMHRHHKDLPDITPDTDGCYNCHPGPKTQCLRDTMSQSFAMNCTDCHGTMLVVSQNLQPWLNEPQCGNENCHGAGYQADQPLYRLSRGHGGIYCAGCHDSPHAITPSREPNDAIKFQELQGHPGTLRDCTVCHATKPTVIFRHMKK